MRSVWSDPHFILVFLCESNSSNNFFSKKIVIFNVKALQYHKRNTRMYGQSTCKVWTRLNYLMCFQLLHWSDCYHILVSLEIGWCEHSKFVRTLRSCCCTKSHSQPQWEGQSDHVTNPSCTAWDELAFNTYGYSYI